MDAAVFGVVLGWWREVFGLRTLRDLALRRFGLRDQRWWVVLSSFLGLNGTRSP